MSGAHDHGHDHSHDHLLASDPAVARALRIAVAVVALAAVVGFALWRPAGGVGIPDAFAGQGERVNATVVDTVDVACAGTDGFDDPPICQQVLFDLTSGPNAGDVGSFETFDSPGAARFGPGDRLVVIEYDLGNGEVSHTFGDYQRATPMLALAALFVAAVIALGRFQGVRALCGLIVSGAVLLAFVFPALLDGQPPLGVALVGATVIAIASLYLAHGVNDTTTVALLGTLVALGLTGVLGVVFAAWAQITGLATEDQIFLLVSAEGVDVRGLVLAGLILGSLGVLDDVTITQVSAVARLREANPELGVAELYRRGVRIGRDHIASTVNTLVLAYAGAALPLLLFYSNIGIGLSESVTSEIVAVEIIRTLVGSIGLIAAVPITTVVAAIVVTGSGLGALAPGGSPAPAVDPPAASGARRRRRPAPDDAPRAPGDRAGGPEPADPTEPRDWDDFGPEADRF